jgi:hypothetical protein
MNFVAFLLLTTFADPTAAAEAAGATPEQPKAERQICKRIGATESRMASKRICKTAKQWRDEQWSEGENVSRDRRDR